MLNPALLWLIAGCVLCLMELLIPTAFVELMMGISAIVVAAISPIVPNLFLQVILWLLFSISSILLSRRLLTPKKQRKTVSWDSDTEGETLTEIAPGQAGRVLFEGNSWRAVCGDEKLAIASHQKVYILSRKGNTLIVLPVNFQK
ncbi:MAG: NfeD family protein [Hydrococcus sp. Prado102]|nr:NfeD family protein [Hydrococcus sp. Prado102]